VAEAEAARGGRGFPRATRLSKRQPGSALQSQFKRPKWPANMALTFAEAIVLVKKPSGMDELQTALVLELLVAAELTIEQGAQLLKTWAERGETGAELFATVEFLRKRAVVVALDQPCFDLCGTGGSALSRYNISTTVAFIVAAAGIPVAKHGNRGSKRPNGSFDLLDELGIPFELSPQKQAQLQRETGVCFLFARAHHPAVGKVVNYRKAAGGRSIFNLAGPLAHPGPIKHQLIGTIDAKTARVVADALRLLKTEGALVVWGEPGIDEVSITGTTGYLHVGAQGIATGALIPPKKQELNYESLPAGDASENAQTFFKLLSGSEKGPLLDMLVENAGAAIDVWNQRRPALGGTGAQSARAMIRSGAALSKFEEHRDLAQELARAH